MPFIPAVDAPQFTLGTTIFRGMAAPSRGATETAMWRVTVAPGSPGATHQLTREEILMCLTGAGTAMIGDDTHTIAPGDTLIVPPLTDFSLTALGDAPLEMVTAFPVGGQATMPGGLPFTPPWAA